MTSLATRILASCFLGASVLLSLGGCGPKGDAKLSGEAAELKATQIEACSCKDMTCYRAVNTRWRAMDKSLKVKYPTREEAPADVVAAHRDGRTAMRQCRRQIRKAEVSP